MAMDGIRWQLAQMFFQMFWSKVRFFENGTFVALRRAQTPARTMRGTLLRVLASNGTR
jgi:hypothetical protein